MPSGAPPGPARPWRRSKTMRTFEAGS
jgi:hypothetical protein